MREGARATIHGLGSPGRLRGGWLPSQQPVEADVEGVGDIAKPIKRKMDCGYGKIAPRVRRKARALCNLLRRKAPRPAGIHKAMWKLRYVRHLISPLDQVNTPTNSCPTAAC